MSLYDHTVVGDNVIIHSGTILGADAFYYKNRPEEDTIVQRNHDEEFLKWIKKCNSKCGLHPTGLHDCLKG